MARDQVITLAAENGVKSLNWHGDELVDFASGGWCYRLDGNIERGHVNVAYAFDAAAVSPSGQFIVLYTKLGTKGLIVSRELRAVREINRSYYFANAYEYPIALFALPDGREVIAHCPDEYDRLEIEEIATGRRLTERPTEHDSDFFHSRLMISPSARWLGSAGWCWHPFDTVCTFDLERARNEPASLDAYPRDAGLDLGSETSAAAFASDSLLIVTSARDADDLREAEDLPAAGTLTMTPGTIGVVDVPSRQLRSVAKLEDEAGMMMPVGDDATYVVGFFEHPKLIHVPTGRTLQRWPDIHSGTQRSSIIWGHKAPLPAIALDPVHRRFAVAGEKSITVVQLPDQIEPR